MVKEHIFFSFPRPAIPYTHHSTHTRAHTQILGKQMEARVGIYGGEVGPLI